MTLSDRNQSCRRNFFESHSVNSFATTSGTALSLFDPTNNEDTVQEDIKGNVPFSGALERKEFPRAGTAGVLACTR